MSMFNRKITLTPDERKQLEKIVNGKKYWGKWSAAKKVKVK